MSHFFSPIFYCWFVTFVTLSRHFTVFIYYTLFICKWHKGHSFYLYFYQRIVFTSFLPSLVFVDSPITLASGIWFNNVSTSDLPAFWLPNFPAIFIPGLWFCIVLGSDKTAKPLGCREAPCPQVPLPATTVSHSGRKHFKNAALCMYQKFFRGSDKGSSRNPWKLWSNHSVFRDS